MSCLGLGLGVDEKNLENFPTFSFAIAVSISVVDMKPNSFSLLNETNFIQFAVYLKPRNLMN